jgi:hypothetical protein
VNAEPVPVIAECEECGRAWLSADNDRWRAYLDEEEEVRFFCRACAEREFGD